MDTSFLNGFYFVAIVARKKKAERKLGDVLEHRL